MKHPATSPLRQERLALSLLKNAIAGLNPVYFAMVMATGIVSLACQQRGFNLVALSLWYLNMGFYGILWGLTLCRLCFFARALTMDVTSHQLAPGFFTLVAGTGVLGVQALVIAKLPNVALALWGLTTVLWFMTTYGIFTLLAIKTIKPKLAEGLNGSWLVAVVATQSVSVLGSLLSPYISSHHRLLLVVCFNFWLLGGMLYIWIIALIFYRYMFFTFEPSELTPPYWINMGAAAISTLAGTNLMNATGTHHFLLPLQPFIEGFSFLFWVTASWWIPLLVFFGLWRYGYKRFPLSYSPQYWGCVFPLGMYTVCTHHLAKMLSLPALLWLSKVFFWLALAAWSITLLGFIKKALLGPIQQLSRR